MKPLVRWTVGPSTPAGYHCLKLSIQSFLRFYDCDIIVAHNCDTSNFQKLFSELPELQLLDQRKLDHSIPPTGVAWKLYPARIAPERHELSIDNDIVFDEHIEEIEAFFQGDHTLLLEGNSRNYGRFDKHVPAGYRINSGIYGMPPGFNLQKYIDFYAGDEWQVNAFGEHAASKTFDEQGIVAIALLNYQKFAIIDEDTVTNCEHALVEGKGMHFIGLNRRQRHQPFLEYQFSRTRMF